MIFHLIDDPVPTLAEPYPDEVPLPSAYMLHLPGDGFTLWYTLAERGGIEYISIQLVRTDL